MLVLTFQVGSHRLALDVRRVHEVVPAVRLQSVAYNPPWLAGVFIYRGQVVPVIDLHRLLQAEDCPVHLSTRIILVPYGFDRPLGLPSLPGGEDRATGQERLVGLLAAKVADIREMPPPSLTPPDLVPHMAFANAPDRPDLGPVLVDGQEIVHLVELDRLLPASYGQQLVLVPKEPLP
jgi:chemotaxis-related protein WspB